MTISLGHMQANLTSTCLHESSARWDGLLMSVWRDMERSKPPLFFAASIQAPLTSLLQPCQSLRA